MQNTNRRYWKIIVIFVSLLLVGVLLRVNGGGNSMQAQADNAFSGAIHEASNGLNVDYTRMNEEERMYFYGRLIANLGAAKGVLPFTSYQQKDHLSNALENLLVFLVSNYTSIGFSFDVETQVSIYNALLEIGSNPASENPINNLNQLITSKE